MAWPFLKLNMLPTEIQLFINVHPKSCVEKFKFQMKILVMMSLFLPFYLKRVTGVDFFSLSFANSFKHHFCKTPLETYFFILVPQLGSTLYVSTQQNTGKVQFRLHFSISCNLNKCKSSTDVCVRDVLDSQNRFFPEYSELYTAEKKVFHQAFLQ